MGKEFLRPNTVWKSPMFSQGVKVGDFIFVSGQTAQDPKGNVVGKGDIIAQTVQVWKNIQAVLESAGASIADVVKTTALLTSADHFKIYLETAKQIRSQYGETVETSPGSTTFAITRLVNPDCLVEVEAIAYKRQ